MKKTSLSLLIMALFVFSTAMSIGIENNVAPEDTSLGDTRSTHTVLVEVGTTQWCGPCSGWNDNIFSFYESGTYDFEYVEMICQNHGGSILIQEAYNRIMSLGLGAWPTSFFDGGYSTIVGNVPGSFSGTVTGAGNRAVADIDASLNVQWLGNANMSIGISIQNNEATTYDGHIRVYVSELISRYDTAYGNDYHHGFLGFAFDEDILITSGGVYTDTTTWDGNDHHDNQGNYFGDITSDNIQIILAVFDGTTDYTDETVAAVPSLDSPPTISNVQATPSVQAPGGPVNVTATVTDDLGVNTVTACITPPGASTPTYYPMTHGSGDTYYYMDTYSTLGTYDYYVRALDTGGNDATSPTYDFLIWEYNPPIITNIQATVLTGDNIDITCSVQDDTEVDTVSINITDPLGGTIQASMVPTGGDTYTYSGTFATLGGYLYAISANDTAGNINITTSRVLMRQMMQSGWNLVTLPLANEHTAGTLGENISGCTTVCRFNGDTQAYTTHVVGIPYNDFPILDGVGYFLYVNTPGIFTATGECISSVTVHLYQQWNMIGWYKETATIVSSLGAALDDCTTICKYDAIMGSYSTHVVGIPYNDFTIEWGMGLFVYTNSESDWQGNG